jgi:hypothetical protein
VITGINILGVKLAGAAQTFVVVFLLVIGLMLQSMPCCLLGCCHFLHPSSVCPCLGGWWIPVHRALSSPTSWSPLCSLTTPPWILFGLWWVLGLVLFLRIPVGIAPGEDSEHRLLERLKQRREEALRST